MEPFPYSIIIFILSNEDKTQIFLPYIYRTRMRYCLKNENEEGLWVSSEKKNYIEEGRRKNPSFKAIFNLNLCIFCIILNGKGILGASSF